VSATVHAGAIKDEVVELADICRRPAVCMPLSRSLDFTTASNSDDLGPAGMGFTNVRPHKAGARHRVAEARCSLYFPKNSFRQNKILGNISLERYPRKSKRLVIDVIMQSLTVPGIRSWHHMWCIKVKFQAALKRASFRRTRRSVE